MILNCVIIPNEKMFYKIKDKLNMNTIVKLCYAYGLKIKIFGHIVGYKVTYNVRNLIFHWNGGWAILEAWAY